MRNHEGRLEYDDDVRATASKRRSGGRERGIEQRGRRSGKGKERARMEERGLGEHRAQKHTSFMPLFTRPALPALTAPPPLPPAPLPRQKPRARPSPSSPPPGSACACACGRMESVRGRRRRQQGEARWRDAVGGVARGEALCVYRGAAACMACVGEYLEAVRRRVQTIGRLDAVRGGVEGLVEAVRRAERCEKKSGDWGAMLQQDAATSPSYVVPVKDCEEVPNALVPFNLEAKSSF
ncbi:hypothetical protein C8R44DRAFT_755193 [Mycena epipterygia]|nr:hypothetical protein C8R44DRAFT_755193 [Mycena epipterygia]